MGKWSRYDGLEGLYFADSNSVNQLVKRSFQDYYLDETDSRCSAMVIEQSYGGFFDTYEEAEAFLEEMLAEKAKLEAEREASRKPLNNRPYSTSGHRSHKNYDDDDDHLFYKYGYGFDD